ncbi:LAQU0S02e10528g1_1 [Lachancea quebecensis]|uniref:Actin-related protein 2/3 complex subunit n=1 Tax=Lachancea quebecensis TaxID=1654605 RepID=A0A0P1KYE2_9SACH|nr:LAQU0S02e10528g1_1 [Lachancea quebecensis]
MSSSIVANLKLAKAPIYSHCFSQDRSLVAITLNTDCLVFRLTPGGKPALVATLPDHDKTVTAVDISIHGRIVTCSQDRNAIVWEPLSDGSYKPTLVLLRINRAATCVQWAPSGYKFAVGSSARIIAVCYYEQENDWWVSKHIKKPIKSTINCVSWHENGVMLACGGTDGYVRAFSGFVKGLDTRDQVANSPWAEKFPFGALIREWYHGAWIHDVQWRSSQEKLAYVAHDGSFNVVDPSDNVSTTFSPEGLPLMALVWINDHEALCGGFSCHPVLFGEGASGWQFSKNIDKDIAPSTPVSATSGEEDEEGNAPFGMSALKKFKELDLKGKVSAQVQESTHENAIVELAPYSVTAGNVTEVSSCGLDGKIVIYRV